MYLYYFLAAGYLQHIVQLSLLNLFMLMDITKFFDRKKRELNSQSTDADNSKNPREESNNSISTPNISW